MDGQASKLRRQCIECRRQLNQEHWYKCVQLKEKVAARVWGFSYGRILPAECESHPWRAR